MDLDPLNPKRTGTRLLSDQGIRQAFQEGLLTLTPPLQDNQLQPASLDLCIEHVQPDGPANQRKWHFDRQSTENNSLMLLADHLHQVSLTQRLESTDHQYLSWNCEARSSLRRLGVYIPLSGFYMQLPEGLPQIEVSNYSPNDINFRKGERIVQFLFTVHPWSLDEQLDGETAYGKQVRSLDMGIELNGADIRSLHGREFTIEPRLRIQRHHVVVHASATAYRFRKVGTIEFNKRNELNREEILEPVDISEGYEIQPGEHLIVETRETFHLSNKIGIRFWDNLIPDVMGRHPNNFEERARQFSENLDLVGITDGWVDPGYQGTFSRQPKWFTPGRIIYPGIRLGMGQVFYFPNGTERSYGSNEIGSQYQNQDGTRLA